MASKNQTQSLQGNKIRHSDLARHYREIGIRAVAAAGGQGVASRQSFGKTTAKTNIAQRRNLMNNDTASKAERETREMMETGADAIRGVQEGLSSAMENVRDLNIRLIDMARASTDAVFDFAHAVARAKKPSDFAEAWTTHATKQFDMLTKQAGELTALSQRFTNATVETVTRRAKQ
jgi:hypothetical protein